MCEHAVSTDPNSVANHDHANNLSPWRNIYIIAYDRSPLRNGANQSATMHREPRTYTGIRMDHNSHRVRQLESWPYLRTNADITAHDYLIQRLD